MKFSFFLAVSGLLVSISSHAALNLVRQCPPDILIPISKDKEVISSSTALRGVIAKLEELLGRMWSDRKNAKNYLNETIQLLEDVHLQFDSILIQTMNQAESKSMNVSKAVEDNYNLLIWRLRDYLIKALIVPEPRGNDLTKYVGAWVAIELRILHSSVATKSVLEESKRTLLEIYTNNSGNFDTNPRTTADKLDHTSLLPDDFRKELFETLKKEGILPSTETFRSAKDFGLDPKRFSKEVEEVTESTNQILKKLGFKHWEAYVWLGDEFEGFNFKHKFWDFKGPNRAQKIYLPKEIDLKEPTIAIFEFKLKSSPFHYLQRLNWDEQKIMVIGEIKSILKDGTGYEILLPDGRLATFSDRNGFFIGGSFGYKIGTTLDQFLGR